MATPIILWLWRIAILFEIVALVRLFHQGLIRRYPLFAAWIFIDALLAASYFILGFEKYFAAYAVVQTAAFAIQVASIRSLISLHLSHYQGIMALTRRLLLGIVAAAIFVSVLALNIGKAHTDSWLNILLTGEQFASVAIALYLLAATALLTFIRVPTRSNILRIERIMTLYFCAQAIAFIAVFLSGNTPNSMGNIAASTLIPAATLLAFSWWNFAVNRQGELLAQPPRPTPEELATLDRLNAEAFGFLKSFRLSNGRGLH